MNNSLFGNQNPKLPDNQNLKVQNRGLRNFESAVDEAGNNRPQTEATEGQPKAENTVVENSLPRTSEQISANPNHVIERNRNNGPQTEATKEQPEAENTVVENSLPRISEQIPANPNHVIERNRNNGPQTEATERRQNRMPRNTAQPEYTRKGIENTNKFFHIRNDVLENIEQKRGLYEDLEKALKILDITKAPAPGKMLSVSGDLFKYNVAFTTKKGNNNNVEVKITQLEIDYKDDRKQDIVNARLAALAWLSPEELELVKEKTANEMKFLDAYSMFQEASRFARDDIRSDASKETQEFIEYLENFSQKYAEQPNIKNFNTMDRGVQCFYKGLLQIKHLREEKKLTTETVKNSLKVEQNNLEKQRSKISPEEYNKNSMEIEKKNAMLVKFAELDPQAIDLFAQIFINRALEKQANNFPNLVFVNDKNEKISRLEAIKNFESNVTANDFFKGFNPIWDKDLVKLARDGRLSDTNLLGNAIDQEVIQTYNFLYNCSKNSKYPFKSELSNSNTVKKLIGYNRIYEFSSSNGERIFFRYPTDGNGNEIHNKLYILHIGGHTNTSRYQGHDVTPSVLKKWDALQFDRNGDIIRRS